MHARDVFLFFYAFFWATAFAGVGRYQAFDTAAAWPSKNADRERGRRARRRLAVAFIILTFLPIGLLVVLYNWVVPNSASVGAVASAAAASLAVFGVHRIFHAIVATAKFSLFYTESEVQSIRKRTPFEEVPTFWAHFGPGVAFLIGWPTLALLFAR